MNLNVEIKIFKFIILKHKTIMKIFKYKYSFEKRYNLQTLMNLYKLLVINYLNII